MAHARDSIYAEACQEKGERMELKDPWKKTRQRIALFLIFIGWILFAMIIYQISLFDYEMANFDPYEILGVSLDADKKTIKSQYKKLSLIYHPDKPTGNEKLFMKLRKAYDALTDETARYNWEHYGNPDGPQAMQFGIGLPAWVLAASLEFERGHNHEIVERPTDNAEIPQLMKSLPNLGINNKEKPLCFGYSVKARALLFAHLSRIPLPKHTLHQDRLYIIKKCPYLIHEMVSCLSQLILLAHAGRIARLPSLDTVEATMKCSALAVQALWDKASPLQQLPHVEEDMLKHFYSKRRNIKSLKQLAMMADEDRRSLLRSVSDEQYKDLMKVLAGFPQLSMTITTEVIDDETQHVVTAGSIVTVTISITRKGLDIYLGSLGFGDSDEEIEEKDADEIEDNIDEEEDENLDKEPEEKEEEKKKGPVWKKPQQKKKAKKPGKQSGKGKQKAKTKTETPATPNAETKEKESGSESEGEESGSEESGSEKEGDKERRPASEQDDQDEEQEWARFQKGMNRREKALSGKSRVSHSVHCPYYTDDKQEFWWVYISDRKTHSLITPPYHLTSLPHH